MNAETERLHELVAVLTLEEKVALVSGADFWSTIPIARIGLRAMVLSDGPAGVRGPVWDERKPSASLPSGTALASSWDPRMAYRFGAAAAGEARQKGVDVVLGPTINLQRSPLGGRHFEAFSEDPLLSGVLGAAYVRGLQDNGVAATPKHYVANDSETDRFTVDVRVSARALRELYLAPFEMAVDAGAWVVMAAYNSIDGVTLTESALLADPLRDDWGFDGVVVSDWTAVRSIAAAGAEIDLAMPGPMTGWSAELAAAISDGRFEQSVLDRKVLRMLRLAERVGALTGTTASTPVVIDVHGFAREAAVAGMVLLQNSDELPWRSDAISSIAVIGQHAEQPRIQGGGSATVIPDRVVSPLQAIKDLVPDAVVAYEVGALVQEGVAELPIERLTNPVAGEPGVHVRFVDAGGRELFTDDRMTTALVWFEGAAPLAEAAMVVIETVYTPEADASVELGFASTNRGRVFVDGELLVEEHFVFDGDDVGLALLAPRSVTAPLRVRAGVGVSIRAEFDLLDDDPLPSAASMTVGFALAREDPEALIARAVAAARAADVALVVVGTNAEVESEGFDRTSLDLPGHQNALVSAVAAVNPRTVVVVNAGSPVLLPWRNEVAAVLLGYFGGQEMGPAIADVVFGVAEPGGRLTTTWPAAILDVPVLDVVPTDGVLSYDEGIHIGYRAWLRSRASPAYPFGWGLGYTSWDLPSAAATGSLARDDLALRVTVTNTGQRAGKQVVQVYAERSGSSVDRPVRWLVAFATVVAGAGEATEVEIPLLARAFSHWDDAAGWMLEPGSFTVRVGSSVESLPLSLEVR